MARKGDCGRTPRVGKKGDLKPTRKKSAGRRSAGRRSFGRNR